MNDTEKLNCAKMFFVKSFCVSFVLLLFTSWMFVLFNDFSAQMAERILHINRISFDMSAAIAFGVWKILIIQFTLVPALVLWCATKKCGCGCK